VNDLVGFNSASLCLCILFVRVASACGRFFEMGLIRWRVPLLFANGFWWIMHQALQDEIICWFVWDYFVFVSILGDW